MMTECRGRVVTSRSDKSLKEDRKNDVRAIPATLPCLGFSILKSYTSRFRQELTPFTTKTHFTASLQVEELAKAKLEKPKRLGEMAAKEWREIEDSTLMFDRQEREVAALRQLEKADLEAFFQVRC